MTQDKAQQVINLIKEETEIDIENWISLEDMQALDTADEIHDELSENSAFEQDGTITYYGTAMEYLSKNDPSLRESIDLMADYGNELKDVNSETLASYHNAKRIEEVFSSIKEDIDAIINA